MAGAIPPAMAAAPTHYKLYRATSDYATVKQEVEIAITNRGLVVDHTSNVGDTLDRTGKDIGTTKKIYGKAEAM